METDITVERIFYYDNLIKEEIPRLPSGLIHGERISHFKNGQIKRTIPYVNGLAEGVSFEFFEDGSLFEERHLKNNATHGIHNLWNMSGTKRFESLYKDGLWDGLQKSLHNDNSIHWFASYKDNTMHGANFEFEYDF